MSDRAKNASAVFFVLVMLLGVTMWIFFALERGLQTAVVLRDVPVEGGLVERRLFSEDIIQAAQFVKPAGDLDGGQAQHDWSRLPAAYWHPHGPAGRVLSKYDWFPGAENTWRADARLPASLVAGGMPPAAPLPLGQLATLWSEPPIGVVQMKAGALAAYARPFQIIDFYESNPEVIVLSRPRAGEAKFTYLRDAERRGARVRVFEGPEIDTFATEAPQSFYRLVFVETARRGDQVAEELISPDAFSAYLSALAPGGVLCVHVSNREPDILFKVADVANDLKLAVVLGEDRGNEQKGHYPSNWLVIARQADHLRWLRSAAPSVRWSPLSPAPPVEIGRPAR
jgi:hypothetical protein